MTYTFHPWVRTPTSSIDIHSTIGHAETCTVLSSLIHLCTYLKIRDTWNSSHPMKSYIKMVGGPLEDGDILKNMHGEESSHKKNPFEDENEP